MKTIKISSVEGLRLVAALVLARDAFEAKSEELEARYRKEAEFIQSHAKSEMTDLWNKIMKAHGLESEADEAPMLDVSYLKEHGAAFIRLGEGVEADEGPADAANLFSAPETLQ